jgi:hypothetical protein
MKSHGTIVVSHVCMSGTNDMFPGRYRESGSARAVTMSIQLLMKRYVRKKLQIRGKVRFGLMLERVPCGGELRECPAEQMGWQGHLQEDRWHSVSSKRLAKLRWSTRNALKPADIALHEQGPSC